ncbi:hypothetical protein G6O69_35785 [Pseudenhygromyxa sp. WMMC2535]|uniref:hypothetical protein n=1 Tax=Pseudenhygromyxa sp. WMMC2535 TaxID=2712867 RepID=UPI0015574D6E|nr:hypothetical protein [Pseudenhygromyxa sp. WMMC2535]NVB43241.1 hypothetical protein [Pseudenhygromyxa sp. WMMC2535]
MVFGADDDAPLASLNVLLTKLRELAKTGEHIELVARALDHAEFLPLLIADRNDRSADFRSVLIELAESHPLFMPALERFDNALPMVEVAAPQAAGARPPRRA